MNHALFLCAPVLALTLTSLPAAGLAQEPFPWTCRTQPLATGTPAKEGQLDKTLGKELQGEWISSRDPGRILDLGEDRFSLQGTGRNLRGTAEQLPAELVLALEDGTSCRVIWQLLGDGRLSLNSGEDILHRRGEPAIPPTRVQQFGSEHCRFTLAVPSVLPLEEIPDGVRLSSVERDAAMQILSGVTDLSAHDFAKAIADRLGSTDFKPADKESSAYTFTCTVRNIPMLQYVVKEGQQYLHVSLMGNFDKLVGYLRQVKIVPQEKEAESRSGSKFWDWLTGDDKR